MDEAINKTNERFCAAARQDAPDSAAWTQERADMHLFMNYVASFLPVIGHFKSRELGTTMRGLCTSLRTYLNRLISYVAQINTCHD